MNSLDVVILVVVGMSAVGGLRRGFVLGTIDLLVFVLALVAGARLSILLAGPLREAGIPDPLAAGAGFFITAVLAYAAVGLAVRLLLSPLSMISSGAIGWVNGILGLLPGAVRGLAIAALMVTVLTMLPAEIAMRQRITGSQLAEPLAMIGQRALDTGLEWADIDPSAVGLSSQRLRSIREGLPFAGATEVQVDYTAEQTLLELVNRERTAAGLAPLEVDSDLAALGDHHGREMFELGYFSHNSPTGGGAADRFSAASLTYRINGENIAHAPSAELAHSGLMDSPAYRANILNPGFTHIGISALRNVDHGLLVTQEFGG